MGLIQSISNALRPKASTPDFNGASNTRRLASWQPSSNGINTMVFSNGEMLRARSRDVARKNAWAAHALDVFVADAIGTGIVPVCKHDNAAARDEFQSAFLRWTDEADANQSTDFYGVQAQVARAIMQDGECFVRVRRRRTSDGMYVPLQLQVLEADYVPLTKTEETPFSSIRGGIEFDRVGRRVAYHMYREHPGEMYGLGGGAGLTYRVPASEVFHLFRPIRPGQIRGLPWFTPVLTAIYDLDQCDDAALTRMKIANMMALFIKKPASGFAGPLNETDNGDGTGDALLEAGSTIYLNEGEEPWASDPPDAGANYDPFLTSHLRKIAVGLGLTYSKLTGDLSKDSFSSTRAGELGYRRFVETVQHQTIVWQLCRPLLPIFLEQAMLAGVLRTRRIEDYLTTEWQPPVWPWIDPEKDIAALNAEVRGGFSSRTRAVASLGRSAEEIDREQQADNKRADDAGIKYDSDGRQAKTATGQQKQEQQQQSPAGGAGDTRKEVVQ